MKIVLAIAATTASFLTVAGCTAIAPTTVGTAVRVTHVEPAGCRYLGEVTGNQGNFLTGGFTSNATLETGARNDLKNKAAQMGGNVVVLLTNRAGVTGDWVNGSGSSEQTNVTLTGTVYQCEQ